MKKIFITIQFLLIIFGVSGQISSDDLHSLSKLKNTVLSHKPDSIRVTADNDFTVLLEKYLFASTKVKLDSIDNLSIIYSQDSLLRVVTWLLPYNNGTFHFHGYIQKFHKHAPSQTFRLTDNHKNIKNPEKAILDNNSWYGALYYNIIDNGNNIFTLLGWNGYNAQTNQKIIEVLSFSTEGNPVFGKAVFANYPSIQTRILFRYSAKTTFSLKYEEVKMLIEKNRILKFRKGSRIVKRKFPLIAFNKLEPMNKGFNSNYKYYIPLTETINAFRYKNGKWLFMEDITIITEKKKSRKKREPKMNLFPKKQD